MAGNFRAHGKLLFHHKTLHSCLPVMNLSIMLVMEIIIGNSTEKPVKVSCHESLVLYGIRLMTVILELFSVYIIIAPLELPPVIFRATSSINAGINFGGVPFVYIHTPELRRPHFFHIKDLATNETVSKHYNKFL